MPPPRCTVCGKSGKASLWVHFGVLTCRACGAFFRRSVLRRSRYVCERNSKCRIIPDGNAVCRACRLQKCYQVGMISKLLKNEVNNAAVSHGLETKDERLIPRLQIAFRRLNSSRDEIYGRLEPALGLAHHNRRRSRGSGRRGVTDFRQISFADVLEVLRIDIELKAEFFREVFPVCRKLEESELQESFFTVMALEASFLTSQSYQDEEVILPCYHSIDLRNIETFEKGQGGRETKSANDCYMSMIHRRFMQTLVKPLRDLQVDQTEMLALSALTFWSSGITGISAQSDDLANRTRDRILKELIVHGRWMRPDEDESLRVAQLNLLIPVLENFSKNLRSILTVSKIQGLIDTDTKTFRMLVGGEF